MRTTVVRADRRAVASAAAIADLAMECLELEVQTYPKPGLVSPIDSGSHADMDIDTFRRSARAIRPYLEALAEAGAQGCGMGRLRVIGLEAEAAMLAATAGVNAHRGAIFGLGLLCAAAALCDGGESLGMIVAHRWGRNILEGPALLHSHGEIARRRYAAGGARCEAARGFPSVYGIGLPALRSVEGDAARVQACFALIAAVEDTNLLHRGGPDGLRFAQRQAQEFLDDGGVHGDNWRERAVAVHHAFVARGLSPGGSADLLAMSLFVQTCEAGI